MSGEKGQAQCGGIPSPKCISRYSLPLDEDPMAPDGLIAQIRASVVMLWVMCA
jgi:hypothetical protein